MRYRVKQIHSAGTREPGDIVDGVIINRVDTLELRGVVTKAELGEGGLRLGVVILGGGYGGDIFSFYIGGGGATT
jgi:hypothetical protein